MRSLKAGLAFFLVFGGGKGGGGGGIVLFFNVPNEFLTMLSKAPQFLSHHCYPKFNVHIYITCRREGDIQKHASLFGSAPCSKNIGHGESNNPFWKNIKLIIHPSLIYRSMNK
jgi:hypothetical protein